MSPLWTVAEVVAATGGRPEGLSDGEISAVSIDSREIVPDALFVAIRGETHDGHDFVGKAIEAALSAVGVGDSVERALLLATLVEATAASYRGGSVEASGETQAEVVDFLWDRVSALLDEHGFTPQVARAAVGGSTTVMGAVRRALLLSSLMGSEGFSDLMALYKRAANLAAPALAVQAATPNAALWAGSGVGVAGIDPDLFEADQEGPLYQALPAAQDGVDGLLAAVMAQVDPLDPVTRPDIELTGLEASLAQVIALKAPLDAFLDGVLVMADDDKLKRNRLALLAGVVAPLRRLGALEFLE